MHRGMCRAIFLQHSFHNIVFSSFFFLLLLLILLFFSSSLSYRFQPRFHESLRRILDRISIDGPLLDFAYSPPPCLFARSRSYLKRSFRRKPWTLRAFRVKSWTDLRINYSAHVSPGCALVCRVRTKSLPPASRFPHFRGHEFHFSLSLSLSFVSTHARSFLPRASRFLSSTSYSSISRAKRDPMCTRRYHSSRYSSVRTPSPLSISKGEIFLVACELDFCGAIPSSPLEHLSQLDDDRVDCVAR